MDKLLALAQFFLLLISLCPFLYLYTTNPQWNPDLTRLQAELLSLACVLSLFLPGILLLWIIHQDSNS